MANKQVVVRDPGTVAVANREVESESVEDTTLSEVHKDLGHTKITEKKATWENEEKTSVVEDKRREQSHSTKSVKQSESEEISANKFVKSSSFSTSESYSSEEEFEIEG